MIEIDRSKSIFLSQYVAKTVGFASMDGAKGSSVVAPRIAILGAGVPLRLRRHERRLLPATGFQPHPAPHRPLRPFDQRRQSRRQLCQIALMCSRSRICHSTLVKIRMAAGCANSPPPQCGSKRNFVVEFISQ
jgi:hypothetical protein